MERDPLRLVWRAAPGLTATLIAIALLAGIPLVLVVLEFVRTAIDATAAGSREGNVTLLRWAVKLPDRISEAPVVLLPGFAVTRRALPGLLALGIAGTILATTLIWWLAGSLAARIGRKVHDLLIARVSEGIASAPASASEDARHAAVLGVEAIGRDRRVLGFLPAIPVLAGAALLSSILWVLLRDGESALALLLALCAIILISGRQTRLRRRLTDAERSVSTHLLAALGDLARNLSAVGRHGTQASESGRIADDLLPAERQADKLERKALIGAALKALLMLAGPLAVLSAGLWASRAHALGPGDAASSVVAAVIAVVALLADQSARQRRAEATPTYAELVRILGAFQARRRSREAAPIASAGRLEATELATPPAPEGRLAGTDFGLDLPSHVALSGPRGGGARIAAALIGGQLLPSRGSLVLAGEDLVGADGAWRARNLAFAGGETYLFPGTLRANLAYGAGEGEDLDGRLAAAIEVGGLSGLVERRGLFGTVDPRREPELAGKLLEARQALRDSLAAKGLSGLIAPFDPSRYNPHATIGENLLFGTAIGDTFREDRLPSQPFMRSLLDAEGLTKSLTAMGAQIARTTLEMFSDLPEGPSILAGYSLVSLTDREEIERILSRRGAGQRGTASGRDTERLIGIAMHYSEPRHRLGLLTAEIEDQLVRVRTQFAQKLPKSLEPAVEIFAADRVSAAASIRDNLLFGRIVQGRANAERDVMNEIRAILDSFGLRSDVSRIGLSGRLDPVDHGMFEGELAAVELVRCLARRPDNLVVEHALDHLSHADAVAATRRLTEAMAGRGLILALPEPVLAASREQFDDVIRFEAGRAMDRDGPVSQDATANGPGERPEAGRAVE